jgi:glycosyltransferase involved in cell wall biosynthesis
VRKLRNDEGLRQRLGDAARRRAEQAFDVAGIIQRIEALYEDLRSKS